MPEKPPSFTTPAAGRPVMTASVPTPGARRRSAGTTSGCGRAADGSATIGARVPSKSRAIIARAGSRTMAASAAAPSGVGSRGRVPPPTRLPAPPSLSPLTTMAGPSRGAALPPRAARRTDPLAPRALPAEPLDEHGIGGHGLRPVDELVEHLVVAGRREPELLGDRLLLGT